MSEILKVPDIGDADSIEVVEWKVKPGDSFQEGEELCDLVTDKAAFALEAPKAGKVIKCLVDTGAKVKVSDPLVEVQF